MTKKKVLALNFATTYNMVSTESQFYCDCASALTMLEMLGYEVWLHDPYKLKRFSKAITFNTNVISTEYIVNNGLDEFAFCITRMNRVITDAILGLNNYGTKIIIEEIIAAVENYSGIIYNIAADFRKSVYPLNAENPGKPRLHARCNWSIWDRVRPLIESGKVLPLTPCRLPQVPQGSYVVSNFMDYTLLHLGVKPVQEYQDSTKEFDYLYGGTGTIKGERKTRLEYLTANIENKALVGKVKLRGWDNVSNNKNLKKPEYAKAMSMSRLQIVFGEPWHRWVTPRFWEALITGSIMVCDSTYYVACELLAENGMSNRIVDSPEDVAEIMSQDLSQLYQEQLDFFNYHTNNLPKPFLT